MPRPKGQNRALGPYETADGKWQVIKIVTDGVTGKSEKRYCTYATRAEAQDYIDEFTAVSSVNNTKLDEALEKYRHHYLVVQKNKAKRWSELRRRIIALTTTAFPHPKKKSITLDSCLSEITPDSAQLIYDALVATGISVDTHRGYLTNTKTFYDWAVTAKLVDANPFQNVKGTGKKNKGKKKLRTDEAVRFANAAFELLLNTKDRIKFERYLMGLTALYIGARASEIAMRRVRDIDQSCTKYIIEDTKTKAGERKEEIPVELQPFFRILIKDRPGTALLFPGRYINQEKPHDHRYVTRYCVRPLCKALGLPNVTAHGLRGTFADLGTEGGLAPLVVAQNLGQNGVRVALDHYISPSVVAGSASKKAHAVLREQVVSQGIIREESPSVTPNPTNETSCN